ncbi:MAG: hypothetical protein ACREJ2_08475 [Planctomycetota bacterium]
MPDPTYDNIKPLLTAVRQDGSSMYCTFKCPKTGVSVEANGGLQHSQSLAGTAVNSTKRNLWWSIRSAVSSTIGNLLGWNIAGRVAQDVAYQASNEAERGTEYSGSEKNAALVRAFQSVQDRFTWDDDAKAWVGKPQS